MIFGIFKPSRDVNRKWKYSSNVKIGIESPAKNLIEILHTVISSSCQAYSFHNFNLQKGK